MTWNTALKLTFGIESPCLDCPDRAPGCHDKCERYAEYKRKVDEIKSRRKKTLEDEALLHPGIKRPKGHWPREKRK